MEASGIDYYLSIFVGEAFDIYEILRRTDNGCLDKKNDNEWMTAELGSVTK